MRPTLACQKKRRPRRRNWFLSNIKVFRSSFSSGPPADVHPPKVEPMPYTRPVLVILQNYLKEQRNFLSKMVRRLVNSNMDHANPTYSWESAPLLVPKHDPSQFRFTMDLRPVHRFTVKHQLPMHTLEQELTSTESSRFYAYVYFSHYYLQLPLDEPSKSCQSLITPDGIYSPTRVLHGTKIDVMYLQSTLASITKEY